jgi:hypothetical protein
MCLRTGRASWAPVGSASWRCDEVRFCAAARPLAAAALFEAECELVVSRDLALDLSDGLTAGRGGASSTRRCSISWKTMTCCCEGHTAFCPIWNACSTSSHTSGSYSRHTPSSVCHDHVAARRAPATAVSGRVSCWTSQRTGGARASPAAAAPPSACGNAPAMLSSACAADGALGASHGEGARTGSAGSGAPPFARCAGRSLHAVLSLAAGAGEASPGGPPTIPGLPTCHPAVFSSVRGAFVEPAHKRKQGGGGHAHTHARRQRTPRR